MVFSSAPIYLDSSNWNQQQAHDQPLTTRVGVGIGVGVESHGQLPPQILDAATAAASRPEAGAPVGPPRPGSMSDRARLAKIPQPEAGLKCPRCESTNTKFCYFNNYSLLQPRHFCKTCRRYWTRGGALRNVPVGGVCRRNKRNKPSSANSSSSKSSANAAATADRHAGTSSSSSTATGGGSGVLPPNLPLPPAQLPFLASLHPLADYSNTSSLGLGFAGIPALNSVDYQLGISSSTGIEQWRLQQLPQFPFLGRMEAPPPFPVAPVPPGYYPFDGEGGSDIGFASQVLPKATTTGLITQLASVKMEDNSLLGLNLPRHSLGISGNDQFWGGGASSSAGGAGSGWTDLSGFNSSSTGHIL